MPPDSSGGIAAYRVHRILASSIADVCSHPSQRLKAYAGWNKSGWNKIGGTMSVRSVLYFIGPLIWAVMILFHPVPGGDSPYEGIRDEVDLWLALHIAQLVLTPFLFLAVWRLLDGLNSIPALVSRSALVVWTVFFSAYDSIQGVATGILAREANGLAGEEQAGLARAIDFLVEDSLIAGDVSAFSLIAGAAWLTCAVTAAVALHLAGAGRAIVVAAAVSTIVAAHTAPAALGFAALFVAGILRERQRSKSGFSSERQTA
jgi:hypothetical protein